MVFDAKSSLCAWFFMLIVATLLWYRNLEYDRIFSVYAILIAIVMLIIYGVQSGTDPLTSGRLTISTILIFIIILFVMTYVTTGLRWVGVITLIVTFVTIFLLFHILTNDYRIDIVCETDIPPYWITTRAGAFIYLLMFVGLIFPFVMLLINDHWSNPKLYIGILFLIISASILVAKYKTTQFVGVWFYSMIILILIYWVLGMFQTSNHTSKI